MRILHVITSLQRAAGTSVFCVDICDVLKTLGHDVRITVIDPNADDMYPSRNNLDIVSLDSILETRPLLSGVCCFDVVHIHALWHPFLHKAAKWARKNKIPIVWSPHGMLAPWAMRHKRWKKWLPWYLYQRTDLQGTALFHATSESERVWILGFEFNRPCMVVPLGTELPVDKGGNPEEKDFKRNILFVGRIYPVKNLDGLIRAFARLRSAFPDWHLLLVGPDQEGHTKELIGLGKMLGLSVEQLAGLPLDSTADIVFTGALFGPEKDVAYRRADLFVLPSHSENFGGVVADALAYGLPCIASDRTPWAELETEECGFWIDNSVDGLESALRRMMELSDSERKRMGRRGRSLVERKYTWGAAVGTLLRGYEMALNSVVGNDTLGRHEDGAI